MFAIPNSRVPFSDKNLVNPEVSLGDVNISIPVAGRIIAIEGSVFKCADRGASSFTLVPASETTAPREGAAVIRMFREFREVEPNRSTFKCVSHWYEFHSCY